TRPPRRPPRSSPLLLPSAPLCAGARASERPPSEAPPCRGLPNRVPRSRGACGRRCSCVFFSELFGQGLARAMKERLDRSFRRLSTSRSSGDARLFHVEPRADLCFARRQCPLCLPRVGAVASDPLAARPPPADADEQLGLTRDSPPSRRREVDEHTTGPRA